jgi:hypothetical protein
MTQIAATLMLLIVRSLKDLSVGGVDIKALRLHVHAAQQYVHFFVLSFAKHLGRQSIP